MVEVYAYLDKDSKDIGLWDVVKIEKEDRPFDYGEVVDLLADGNVRVFWGASGCGCSSPAPVENPRDLTLSSNEEWDKYLDKLPQE